MASNTSPDNLRGFIVPFPLDAENQWDVQSVMTQGTRRAGLPDPAQSSALVLQTSGLQGLDIIDIKTSEAGHIQNKPKFEWKESTESTYYGCDAANMMSHWQSIISTSTSTTTIIPRDAIKLSTTGEVLILCEQDESSDNKIRLNRYSLSGATTSVNISTVTKGMLAGQSRHGALCEMPDQSILLAYWVANNIDNTAQIYIYRSTDDGISWTLRSKRALPANIDISGTPGAGATGYDLGRIRLAANSSQVILLAELVAHNTSLTRRNLCGQYASTSEGLKYDLVVLTDGTSGFPRMDVVTVGEAFVVSWLEIDSIKVTRLSNAFESINKVLTVLAADTFSFPSNVGVATSNEVSGQKSMWLDDDQRLFIVAESVAGGDAGNVFIAFSELVGVSYRNLGKTWIQMSKGSGSAAAVCYSPRDTDDNLTNLIGCAGNSGDQMLFANMDPGDTGNNYKGSLFCVHLGGYATTNYPELIFYPEEQNRGFNYLDWLPIRLPGVTGWTASGTGSETLLGDRFQLDVSAGNTKAYSQSFTDKTGGFIAKWHTKVITGASVSKGTALDVQIEQLAGSDVYLFRVVIGINYVYLYDVNTSTTTPLSSATGITNTDGLDLILQVDNANGNVELHYRASSSSARRYSKITGSGATASGSGNQVKFGVTSGHVADIECQWFNVSYSIGATRTGKLIDLTKLNAKPYPPSGYFCTIVSGLKLTTKDGPARESETWQIPPKYDTAATRMLYKVHPSSKVGWRSDTIATPDSADVPQERIAWQLDTALTQDHRIPGGTLGIHLRNINFKDITLERYDTGSTAWISVATFANGIPFNFTRAGHSISSSDSTGEFFHYAEAVGWRIMLISGETKVVRKVKFNSEGVLSNATVKQAVFELEDALSGDPTSGSAFLIPDSLTMLFSNNTNTAGYRLNLSAQRTREGYMEIGKMVMGPVLFPAHQYGRGRTIQFQADVSSSELSNGILRSNKQGQGGRNIRIAWTEGVDISALFEAQASPNYYTSSTNGAAIPTAAEGSAPTSMLGLVSYLAGSTDALVYLPIVRRTAATEISLNRYHEHMMGTMSDDVQIENVVGDEILGTGQGEVMRVGTVTLREIR